MLLYSTGCNYIKILTGLFFLIIPLNVQSTGLLHVCHVLTPCFVFLDQGGAGISRLAARRLRV